MNLYISVSSRPGKFGATVFNFLFRHYNLDSAYVPLIAPSAKQLIQAMRGLGISGAGVSMPLKSEVVPFLDKLDSLSAQTQSVNTIVNSGGRLKGYNTDIWGCLQVLKHFKKGRVLIYGYGSVTGSVVLALRKLGFKEIHMTGRNSKKVWQRCRRLGISPDDGGSFDLLINATPLSQAPSSDLLKSLDRSRALFDLSVSPAPTVLCKKARQKGKVFVPGVEMAMHQLMKQFELYTGKKVSKALVQKIVKSCYLEKY